MLCVYVGAFLWLGLLVIELLVAVFVGLLCYIVLFGFGAMPSYLCLPVLLLVYYVFD